MRFPIKYFPVLLFICFYNLISTGVFAQTDSVSFEEKTSFFPNAEVLQKEAIIWGYLHVPENWEAANGKTIDLAVAILKNTSNIEDANALVMIEGGPGAATLVTMLNWLNHPLRQNHDIVLMDVRGTGMSRPRLCPGLGNEFLKILATNQSPKQDELAKAKAAMTCKESLIEKEIDINAYHSGFIARDLHALKNELKYKDWNVYGVSYGTYMAQVYANNFPEDIKTLILDSAISDISAYYNYNTSNYLGSLKKVFNSCKNDPECNDKYPDLEEVYFQTIEKLTDNPITVKVDKNIIPDGSFTYNAEDFKIAIQQALYQKQLIEVLPLLIYQFNKGNESTLSALVAAFSGALGLDYGLYYCVTCSEAIPNNSIIKFNADASNYKKLKGGMSFYKSDFIVCDKWNTDSVNIKNDLSKLNELPAPVLVFSGGFDPITPANNGKVMKDSLMNAYLIEAPDFGHAPSFSFAGNNIVNEFVNNPLQKPDALGFKSDGGVNYIADIKINGGVSKLGNSLNSFDLLFLAPLIISVLVLLFSIFFYLYSLIKNKRHSKVDQFMKVLVILTSVVGLITITGFVLALNATAAQNFYILAFGLPSEYNYLFQILFVFLGLLILTTFYFLFRIARLSDRSIVLSVIFSQILLGVYYTYWGFWDLPQLF